MINKVWTVFALTEAVSGISNEGIEYDDYAFTLSKYSPKLFNSQKICEEYIQKTMEDYKRRCVDKGARFVIMEVFCFDNDNIFTHD